VRSVPFVGASSALDVQALTNPQLTTMTNKLKLELEYENRKIWYRVDEARKELNQEVVNYDDVYHLLKLALAETRQAKRIR